MGCDIHMVLERKNDAGKWIGIDTFSSHHAAYNAGDWFVPNARARNYDRFAALAGVRGDGPKPLGLPEDISDTTELLSSDWGGDGHSHSWLPIKEAAKIFLNTDRLPAAPDSLAARWPESYYFGVDDESGLDDYRIVFWFDN